MCIRDSFTTEQYTVVPRKKTVKDVEFIAKVCKENSVFFMLSQQ